MKTDELILQALQELYDEFDPNIKNYNYRGSYKIIPYFTFKQIAEKVPKTIPTIRKWCHKLEKDKKITMRSKRRYMPDPFTYEVSRIDFKPIRLIPYKGVMLNE